jgi:hypothetical protein
MVISRRPLSPTGQPECQEYFTVARVTLLIRAENAFGPVGDGLAVVGDGGSVGSVADAGGGGEVDAAGDPPPQAEESAAHIPVMITPRVTRCIFEGLHV